MDVVILSSLLVVPAGAGTDIGDAIAVGVSAGDLDPARLGAEVVQVPKRRYALLDVATRVGGIRNFPIFVN